LSNTCAAKFQDQHGLANGALSQALRDRNKDLNLIGVVDDLDYDWSIASLANFGECAASARIRPCRE
jgi:hypothetical protein